MKNKLKYAQSVRRVTTSDGFGKWLSVRASYVYSVTKLLSCVTVPCLTYSTGHTKYIIYE